MELALQFFRDNEIWIYLGLGVLALWQIRKFSLAWNELRGALFGMEREQAQGRLNTAALMIVLLLVMAVTEFTLVTIVAPSVPGAMPLSTPTLDLLATPTTTLPAAVAGEATPEVTPTPGEQPAAEGCTPGQVNLTAPKDGEQVSGEVTLMGTADTPNFGFYTYEIARPRETVWLPIQVGQTPVKKDFLGTWSTNTLAPGEYNLRLVVTDNVGNALPPCIIRVMVVAEP